MLTAIEGSPFHRSDLSVTCIRVCLWCHWLLGFLLPKSGHRILNVRKILCVCSAHEGKKGIDETAKVLAVQSVLELQVNDTTHKYRWVNETSWNVLNAN